MADTTAQLEAELAAERETVRRLRILLSGTTEAHVDDYHVVYGSLGTREIYLRHHRTLGKVGPFDSPEEAVAWCEAQSEATRNGGG